MKRYLYVISLALLLTLTLVVSAFADGGMLPPGPYGSDCKTQGYVPIRATFPDGSVEYKVGVCWGANPLDGKISLYKSDVSPKLAAFLDANDVQLTSGQYDLYSVYMHYGNGFTMIDTNGCQRGSGEKAYYGGDPRQMPADLIQSYIPQMGEAVFKNNTNMSVCSDVRVTYNSSLIDKENCKFFWPWESYTFRFEPQKRDGEYVATINNNRNIRITEFSPEMILQRDFNPENDSVKIQLKSDKPGEDAPVTPVLNSNLKAVSIELLNKDMTPHSGDIVVNTSYKVRAKFTSTFNEGGWVKLRLYSWKEAGWMDEKISEYIYMQPNSSIEKVWDYNGGLGKTTLYSSINYRYGDSWIGEAYNSIMETDYSDNYCSLSRGGAGITDRPPEATGFEYSLYYHPMKLHEEPIIEKQPVYGWKMVDFIKGDDDTKFWVGSRLVFPDQVDIDR